MKKALCAPEASPEIVRYNSPGIPLYIQRDQLALYPDMQALCHWHEDLEFLCILDGFMNYSVNGKKIPLSKGSCLLVNSRQIHYGFSENRQDCDFVCIVFHPQLFTGNPILYQKYILPVLENPGLEYLLFSGETQETLSIRDTLCKILSLKEEGRTGYELEVIGLIDTLWSRLLSGPVRLSSPSGKAPSNDLSIQKDMVSFIHRHYTEKLSLASIAASGSVCRSKCCALFKRYMRQSPIDFLNCYRLEVSRGLLENTSMSITQIATSCGFNHLSYYSRLFLRNYGCTPGDYRKKQD